MSRNAFTAIALVIGLAFAAMPASAQVANPSFELNAIGTPQGWTFNANGGGSFISTFDVSMPTDGSRFAVMTGGTNGPATPHSNPGGVGTDATGTVSLSQTFTTGSSLNTTLGFDAVFLGNDGVNADFLEVSISDGTVTRNILHLDTLNDVGGPFPAFTLTGLLASSLTSTSVDLGILFPGASANTPFTLTIHLGNAGDNLEAPRAHLDNFTLTTGTPFLANDVRFIPQSTSVKLTVRTELPFTEYYTLVSHDVSGPKGLGSFGGLYLDTQTLGILTLPLGSAGLHDLSNAQGEFEAVVFLGLAPVGFVFDYMLAALLPTGIEITPVKRGSWGVAEDT